ncbi:hypothetical protein V1L52_01030 [Treponema sp. HNW]|uniref:hypothetical protein n=1 Tax=Treponema sp. HNW TaxID=3116654 RepID=UPI003D1067DC
MEINTKKTDYWRIVFVASALGAASVLSKSAASGFSLKISPAVLTVLFAAVCGSAGAGIYAIVKNKKILFKVIAYVCELALIFAAVLFLTKLSSDKYIVKKEWKVVQNGEMSFAYPGEFVELKTDTGFDNVHVQMFYDGKKDRLAFNGILDFENETLLPEDSLSAAILNPLENLGASNIEWFDTEFYENAVESKVRYTTGKTDRIGYGFLYHREKHYEFCIFLPHTKNFSADFLEKIRTSIRLPIRNSSITEGD